MALAWRWVMTNLVPGLLSIDASRFGGSMKRISAFVLSEPNDKNAGHDAVGEFQEA